MRKTILVVASVALAMLVAGGVAWAATIRCSSAPEWHICYGTSANDTIHGTFRSDFIRARAGKDTIYGYKGHDEIVGGTGLDKIFGGPDGERGLVANQPTADVEQNGDAANDYVHGGKGNDSVVGNLARGGVDYLYGERGSDRITATSKNYRSREYAALPPTKAVIDCGPGTEDEVWFDEGVDVVKANCEIKHPL